MGKSGKSKQAQKKAKSSKASKLAQKAINTEVQDKIVSLTIKVPEALRQHWQIEAKKRGTPVTRLIVEYLSSELGTS